MGLSSLRAFAKASSPHGNQSTGLWACWSRYGLVSWARRFGTWALGQRVNGSAEIVAASSVPSASTVTRVPGSACWRRMKASAIGWRSPNDQVALVKIGRASCRERGEIEEGGEGARNRGGEE